MIENIKIIVVLIISLIVQTSVAQKTSNFNVDKEQKHLFKVTIDSSKTNFIEPELLQKAFKDGKLRDAKVHGKIDTRIYNYAWNTNESLFTPIIKKANRLIPYMLKGIRHEVVFADDLDLIGLDFHKWDKISEIRNNPKPLFYTYVHFYKTAKDSNGNKITFLKLIPVTTKAYDEMLSKVIKSYR